MELHGLGICVGQRPRRAWGSGLGAAHKAGFFTFSPLLHAASVDAELMKLVTFSLLESLGDCGAMPIPNSTFRAIMVRHSRLLSRMRSFWAVLTPSRRGLTLMDDWRASNR